MSYDFRLCLPVPGRDPLEIALEDSEERTEPPGPEETARNRRVARVLQLLHPGFTTGGDASTGEVELTDEVTGLQIGLHGDEAGLSIPFVHEGEQARAVFALAQKCLGAAAREGGYFIYDAQDGGILETPVDLADALACYGQAIERIRQRRARSGASPAAAIPAGLGRAAYLLRWTGSLLAGVAVAWAVAGLTRGTAYEAVVLVPLGAWFVFKLLVLDVARLRDMGREPRATFLSLLGPVAAYMQLWLFFAPGVNRSAAKRPAAGGDDEAPDAARLYPYLVRAEYLQYGESDTESLAWPVGHGLHFELVFDHDSLVSSVRSRNLAQLGLTGEQARQRALANLDLLLASGRVREAVHTTPEGELYLVLDGHWAAATALVWPGLAGLGGKLPGAGPLVAGVPHRDALCLFQAGDVGHLARMRALIGEQLQRGRKPLTDALFALTPEGIREFDP